MISIFFTLLLATTAVYVHDHSVQEPAPEITHGSPSVKFQSLSNQQIDNLSLLAKVWGFLKYHHPAVMRGEYRWDDELLRMIPIVMKSPSFDAAQQEIVDWIVHLTPYSDCWQCAQMSVIDLVDKPDLDWIGDGNLSEQLRIALNKIYLNRPANNEQYYVRLAAIGNPEFIREEHYRQLQFPNPYYQLLALFRFWNVIQYWTPGRELIANRDQLLRSAIPEFFAADSGEAYQLALVRLSAKIEDTHTKIYSGLALLPPQGPCNLPVKIRFVEHQAIIEQTDLSATDAPLALYRGDILKAIDHRSIEDLLKEWKPHYAASNQATRLRDMATFIGRGECRAASLTVLRGMQQLDIDVVRRPVTGPLIFAFHEKPGASLQDINDEIAYLKLSAIKKSEIQNFIVQIKNKKSLIVDLRGYPGEMVAYELGGHLVKDTIDFVRFTNADLNNPGAFYWGTTAKLYPKEPFWAGKLIVLVDETTQSAAEYTAMALRAVPGTVIIGSTTAGTDGNISTLPLPGPDYTYITGLGVFYPDKRATQRIGIIPDIVVRPTIIGIQAQRDELLDAAKSYLAELSKFDN